MQLRWEIYLQRVKLQYDDFYKSAHMNANKFMQKDTITCSAHSIVITENYF